jgi:hypothetical protein
LQQEYLKKKLGALIGGVLLIAFFLLKDGIWDLSRLFFLCPFVSKKSTH